MEPKQVLSLDDLAPAPVPVPLALPSGATAVIALRPLSEGAVFALRQGVKWPEPPIKDMTKTGPVYDYSAQSYLDAMRAANRRLTCLVLLAMLPFAVAGETDDERLALLQSKVGQTAYIQLAQAANRLNSIGEEEIASLARSFRPSGEAGAPLDAAPAIDAGPVAGAAQG